jgi:hypothetical protein
MKLTIGDRLVRLLVIIGSVWFGMHLFNPRYTTYWEILYPDDVMIFLVLYFCAVYGAIRWAITARGWTVCRDLPTAICLSTLAGGLVLMIYVTIDLHTIGYLNSGRIQGFIYNYVFLMWNMAMPTWAMQQWLDRRIELYAPNRQPEGAPSIVPVTGRDIGAILLAILGPAACWTTVLLSYRAHHAHLFTWLSTCMLHYELGYVLLFMLPWAFVALAARLARNSTALRRLPWIAFLSVGTGYLILTWWEHRGDSDIVNEMFWSVAFGAWCLGMPAMAMNLWASRRAEKLAGEAT